MARACPWCRPRKVRGAVKLVVADAKTNMPLWSGTEQPKFAMKQKNREDNVLQAAQRLVTRLRERVEPEP